MTSELFEEWLKLFNLHMRKQRRRVCLFVDNFNGHFVSYQPTNVCVEFFEPNMTSFVQPCDAGVIRCFKATYRRNFCSHALDLDDAGEREIYKIDLLEAMTMAKKAWNTVTSETIAHCWNHTGIQPDASEASSLLPYPPHADTLAWDIIQDFATSDMSLPEAESQLQAHLGDRFVDSDWQPALRAVMEAEGDADKASAAVDSLRKAAVARSGLKLKIPARKISRVKPEQSVLVEEELISKVELLKSRNRIFGDVPTIDELVNPISESEQDELLADSSVEGIVQQVRLETAMANGEAVEVEDSDSDDECDGESAPTLSRRDLISLCQQLALNCMQYGDPQASLDLSDQLLKFRATLQREELLNSKQSTLHRYFVR